MWDTAPNPDDSPLTEQLRQSLAGAGLKAPSLPDVALQIGMASREDDLSTPSWPPSSAAIRRPRSG